MEKEVKLAFKDRESLFSAASSDWFAAHCSNKESSPLTLENYYLDTKDSILRSRGAVFRKRHYTGGGTDAFEFTAKCIRDVKDGVHERYEWNVGSYTGSMTAAEFIKKASETDGDDPEILKGLLSGIGDKDLSVLCSNIFERTLYEFSYGSSTMEACIDYGEIKDFKGKTVDVICEMELELMKGNAEDLEAAKAFIMANTDAVPFNTGKFERTLRASHTGGTV